MRLRAVLLAADGMGPSDVAAWLDTSRISVMRWLARFRDGGLPALEDRPKSGCHSTVWGDATGENRGRSVPSAAWAGSLDRPRAGRALGRAEVDGA